MSKNSVPICHAFFENCFKYRLSFETTRILFVAQGLIAVLAAVLFLRKKIEWAWWLLVLLQIVKVYWMISDYRTWYMHFYMSFFVTFCFLFLKPRIFCSAVALVLCYFWAGVLKFDSDWTSGLLLRDTWKVFPEYLSIQSKMALVLEVFLIWFIFSKRKILFYSVFVLLLLFHILSWHVVTFFYPLVMACLLPVLWAQFKDSTQFQEVLKPANVIVFLIFCTLQVIPWLRDSDGPLLGGGRMFYGIHMFHRSIDCEMRASYKVDGKLIDIDLPQIIGFYVERHKCEPIMTINAARFVCRTQNIQSPLHVVHKAKFRRDVAFKEIFVFDDFCNQTVDYVYWGENEWMKK